MILTTKGRYAVVAALYLAKYGKNKAITLAEIANDQFISLNYLEQIFAKLKNASIVESIRGPGGGYKLKQEPHLISIHSLTRAVEEEIMMTKCGNKTDKTCLPGAVKCLAHSLWDKLENQIGYYLSDITLGSVLKAKDIDSYTYLDHNATTPMLSEVRQFIFDLPNLPSNPSSIHYFGRSAKVMVEDARERVASSLGINQKVYSICFTSSAAEANNLLLHNFRENVIAISTTEHLSVLEPAKGNAKRLEIKVDRDGLLCEQSLRETLEQMPSKSLLSVIYANNETGVIQNIKRITELAHEKGILVHSDCAQSYGKIPLNIAELGLDFATISSHKIGGPSGAAALIHRANFQIKSQITGGGQERGARSGTENVNAIAGFGKAAEIAARNLKSYSLVSHLRDQMESAIQDICPDAIIFGKNTTRLPNTSMISMPHVDVQTQLIYFDLNGLCLSGGSACSSGKIKNSHVLLAMGYTQEEVRGAVRVSLGATSTIQDVEKFAATWQVLHKKSITKVA